jgi:hypothetical protein
MPLSGLFVIYTVHKIGESLVHASLQTLSATVEGE